MIKLLLVMLSSITVLSCGGGGGGAGIGAATGTGLWSATATGGPPLDYHTATLLPNGKVLVAGGTLNLNRIGEPFLANSWLYAPATEHLSATGSLVAARGLHTATLLPNGKVLVTGGFGGDGVGFGDIASAELYNPGTGLWSATGSLASAPGLHTATLLPNGKVLVTGGVGGFDGWGGIASSELYW